MKIFVKTQNKILFIECEASVDTFQDLKERVIMLSSASGSCLYYCGKEVDYTKTLQEYNIYHTGYVLKWN